MKQKILRKLRSTAFKRRLLVYCGLVCFVVMSLYGLSAKLACLDIVLDYKISHECSRYYRNEVTGTFCPELCAGNSIASFSCIAEQPAKVLGLKQGGHTVVLSQVRQDETYEALTWVDKEGKLHFPTAAEFENLVRRLVLFNFNISTLPHNQVHFWFGNSSFSEFWYDEPD